MTQVELAHLIQALENVHEECGKFWNEYDPLPLQGCQAYAEVHSFERPESSVTAFAQGDLLIDAAADQLSAFTKTITEPAQSFAPWTCARAVIESCAIACWLLDPAIESKERVKRSLALRYEGLSEEVKYGRLVAHAADIAKVKTRIDEVEQLALKMGYDRILDKNGKRAGIAMSMPTVTKMVNDTLNMEADFRFLSAVVHGHFWALLKAGLTPIAYGNIPIIEGSPHEGSYHAVEKHLDLSHVAYLCIQIVRVFAHAMSFKCQLFGWDSKHLKQIFKRAFNSLGVQS